MIREADRQSLIWILVSFAATLTVTSAASSPGEMILPTFTNVAKTAGIQFVHISGEKFKKRYLFEAKGGGAGFFDLDNDGWMDLLMVQGSTMELLRSGRDPHPALYRNRGDGTFEDVTGKAGLTRGGWGMGVTFGDYNNDGFADVYLTNLKENTLYKNNGDGTFTDVTTEAGVGDTGWSSSAAFGDYDGDGLLDLFVCNYIAMNLNQPPEPGSRHYCNYRGEPSICGPLGLQGAPNHLYRNNGDGTFKDVSESSGVFNPTPYFSLAAVWADLDSDGDPDLMVANDSTPNEVYANQGDGTFKEIGFLSGLAAGADGQFQASMGLDAADYDNDGLLDVFSTHFANDYSTLYRNVGNFLFQDVTHQARILQPEWLLVSWGTRFADLNHDGWKDIVHANGHVYPFLLTAGWAEEYYQPPSLYLNRGDGTFQDVRLQAGEDFQEKTAGRGAAFADYDNDGDWDMVITNLNDSPGLFRNELSSANHWIMFKVRGVTGNRDGIGARITLFTGDQSQVWEIKRAVSIYSASDPRAHFGLGSAPKADKVQVRWPNGKFQEFRDVPADTHYLIDEESGLSPEFQ